MLTINCCCHQVLYCRDKKLITEEIFGHFTPNRCPSLAGKPKFFFIQACQGESGDAGTLVHVAPNFNSEPAQKDDTRKTDKLNA